MVSAFGGDRLGASCNIDNSTTTPHGVTGYCIYSFSTRSFFGNHHDFVLYNPTNFLPMEADHFSRSNLFFILVRDDPDYTNPVLQSFTALMFSAMRRHAQVYFCNGSRTGGQGTDGAYSIEVHRGDVFQLKIEPFTY